MEGLEVLGYNLPFYIAITLLLSYLIWSKFLKGGELIPRRTNDLFDIITLFLFIFLSLAGLLVLSMTIISMLSFKLWDIPLIWKVTTYIIAFLAILCIIALITSYRHKKPNRKHLNSILSMLVVYQILLISLFSGFLIQISITEMKHLFTVIILYLLVVMIFLIAFCSLMVKDVFKLELKKFLLDKKLFLIIGVIIIISAFFSSIYIPSIEYKEPINLGYHFYYNPSTRAGKVYSKIRIPIKINHLGKFTSLINVIPISYNKYGNLSTEEIGGENFELFVKFSKTNITSMITKSFREIKERSNKRIDKYGFTYIKLDEDKQLIYLVFDRNKIEKEGINEIILDGYITKNIEDLGYNYSDNHKDSNVCNKNGCSLKFTIENNLDLPVFQEEYTFINFNSKKVINKTSCKFINVRSNYPEFGDIKMIKDCDEKTCGFEISDRNQTREKKYPFKMDLRIESNLLKFGYINFKKPLEIVANFNIVC